MGACSESGYVWTQTVYETTGNILTNPDFSNQVKKTLQVHVCRNITKAMNTNCSSKGLAPVYMVKTSPSFSPYPGYVPFFYTLSIVFRCTL